VSDLGRLRWRCRRGIKELDVLLTRYLDERFAHAPHPERLAFERLLQTEDPLIYAYCLGQVPVPADLSSVVERITACTGAAEACAGPSPRC
jgi:antitoxin CptB